jgi:hypothetical protein
MQIAYESTRDHFEKRLDQMEHRYHLAQEELANATASYETLREMPDASERRLRQALQQISRAQRHVHTLRNEIEELEDLDSMA